MVAIVYILWCCVVILVSVKSSTLFATDVMVASVYILWCCVFTLVSVKSSTLFATDAMVGQTRSPSRSG